MYEILKHTTYDGSTILILRLQDIHTRTTPYTQEEIRECFNALAHHIGIQSELSKLELNDTHEMLNSEGGIILLHDYIAHFSSGDVLLNLGCCFFVLQEIAHFSEQGVREVVSFLLPEAYKAQPLVMKQYARRCFEKKEDALSLVGD